MTQRFSIDRVEQLATVAAFIIEAANDFPIIRLEGEMGSGKTTLVRSIMQQLGVDEANSPTFSLVNRYDTSNGPWYHFDLYRIKAEEELLDIGFEEYLDSGRPCLIEWPQLATALIGDRYLHVSIMLGDKQRTIEVSSKD